MDEDIGSLQQTKFGSRDCFVTVRIPSAQDGVARALRAAYGEHGQRLPEDMLGMLDKLNKH